VSPTTHPAGPHENSSRALVLGDEQPLRGQHLDEQQREDERLAPAEPEPRDGPRRRDPEHDVAAHRDRRDGEAWLPPLVVELSGTYDIMAPLRVGDADAAPTALNPGVFELNGIPDRVTESNLRCDPSFGSTRCASTGAARLARA
jgi:hypothetical protein